MKLLRWVPSIDEFIIFDNEDEERRFNELPYSHFISRQPLHWLWTSTRNISQEELLNIETRGYEVKRGRFSEKEDRRIGKNWKRWARQFPDLSDPFIVFGIKHRPLDNSEEQKSDDEQMIPSSRRRKLKRLEFTKRMAYKLDKRLICDIIIRAKRIIAYKMFKYRYLSQCEEELLDEITIKLHEDKESDGIISSKMNVSPQVVSYIKRRDPLTKPYKWNSTDDVILEECLSRQFAGEDVREIPSFKIDWEKAQQEMVTCGYKLTKLQIYKRWRRLNSELFGLRRIR